eukprot:gene31633-43319_t
MGYLIVAFMLIMPPSTVSPLDLSLDLRLDGIDGIAALIPSPPHRAPWRPVSHSPCPPPPRPPARAQSAEPPPPAGGAGWKGGAQWKVMSGWAGRGTPRRWVPASGKGTMQQLYQGAEKMH